MFTIILASTIYKVRWMRSVYQNCFKIVTFRNLYTELFFMQLVFQSCSEQVLYEYTSIHYYGAIRLSSSSHQTGSTVRSRCWLFWTKTPNLLFLLTQRRQHVSLFNNSICLFNIFDSMWCWIWYETDLWESTFSWYFFIIL